MFANVFKCTLALTFALTLGACAKTASEIQETKTQDAESLISEHRDLAHSLAAKGGPDSSWSKQELTDYVNGLDRLSGLESRMAKVNGQNGVTIIGGQNTEAIASARARAESLLSAKR